MSGQPPTAQVERLLRRKRKRSPWRRAGRALARVAVVAAVVAAALYGVFVWWATPRIEADPRALARLDLRPAGERLVRVGLTDAVGRAIPLVRRSGRVEPAGKVSPGVRIEVSVTVRRSRLVGWLLGRTQTVSRTFTTPAAPQPAARLVHPSANGTVTVRFDVPAAVVSLRRPGGGTRRIELAAPVAAVPTNIAASGANRAGSVYVAAAARTWETLPAPVRVAWFPRSTRTELLARPAAGDTRLEPLQPIELMFSVPVESVLGSRLPVIAPQTSGRWLRPDPNTLVFQPSGSGFGLGSRPRIVLPQTVDLIAGQRTRAVRSLSWQVPQGSTLRLQQLLAQLGYLPVAWHPDSLPVAATARAEAASAIEPPPGHFSWRYPNTPAELQQIWNPTTWSTITQGAVMAFEHDHNLAVDGLAGPRVWGTLIEAAVAGHPITTGYTYVLVHRTVPQTLILWHDGRTILTARVNTGVPAAPTPFGTHPVFEHIASGTMAGTNPGGSHYNDPGVKWISYFHGGEAIHGFNRPTYGFPQSVGCVEAPIPTAAKIWPYTPIGTLVTIVP